MGLSRSKIKEDSSTNCDDGLMKEDLSISQMTKRKRENGEKGKNP